RAPDGGTRARTADYTGWSERVEPHEGGHAARHRVAAMAVEALRVGKRARAAAVGPGDAAAREALASELEQIREPLARPQRRECLRGGRIDGAECRPHFVADFERLRPDRGSE